MSTKEDRPKAASSASALVLCLMAMAIVSVFLGLLAGTVVLLTGALAGQITPFALLWAVVSFAAGCSVGAVLWALGWLCRNNHQRWQTERRMAIALEALTAPGQGGEGELGAALPAAPPPPAKGEPDQRGGVDPRMRPVLRQLRELNVNILLSDAQREAKRRYLTERESQRLQERIAQAAAAGKADDAQGYLDELVRLAPDSPEIKALREEVERTRQEAEQHDLAEASAKVENLMSTGEFDAAVAVGEGLLARHPALPAAISMLARVRREREAFVTERRSAMYQKIELEATQRHWQAAKEAADVLLQAFPDSPEADAVKAQMGTISDNARLEEVRRLRDGIADLIERRRYGDAAERSRELIERFPGTAAAEDLRKQMPRLEELAGSEDAVNQGAHLAKLAESEEGAGQ